MVYSPIKAQEEVISKWQFDGYVSSMSILSWDFNNTFSYNQIIHNRLNFDYYFSDKLTFNSGIRNRVFYGDFLKGGNAFVESLDSGNDYFDLSFHFPKDKDYAFHTIVDRAYLEWYHNDWEVRLGRQRVNWGINLVWNPNDLFNTYSFFDFDYIERPGADALLIKKYIGFSSSIELVSNVSDKFSDLVIASKYSWNAKNYDFQFIVGKAREDLSLGFGWAGNIGNAGFKGELSYFHPYDGESILKKVLITSITVDFAFTNGLYLNGSILFNSDDQSDLGLPGININSNADLTARDLSPFPWSIFIQGSYPITPLFNISLSTIYFPDSRHALFINPGINYSLSNNTQVSIIFQWYYDKILGDYDPLARLIYLRAKWNF